jgi:UDP-N-acetyl-D-glucosamine/UDP-N-acetyl-D-galactosamine dehydrogenase
VVVLPRIEDVKVAVIGLGYVGLPLAVHLGRQLSTIGYDISERRIEELRTGQDRTREFTKDELKTAEHLAYTSDMAVLKGCNFFIVAVPTPIDASKRPDLTPLEKASELIGKVIAPGGVAVFESTVYPGATEEICVPIIARVSGLEYNKEFFAGYSPERINPADPEHGLANVRKITSGSTPAVAELVDSLYRSIVTAGTHRASSIRIAEAAKVIENVQRDVNIALINELAQLFKKMGLETREVLEAADTKWNFHYYRPGLVGGHCIGVDPYYLTHKAQTLNFHPEMILAGRRINDGMAAYIARDIIKMMLMKKLRVDAARILVLGITFKQNCPDVRNTKVADLVAELTAFGHNVTIYDPLADAEALEREYNIKLTENLPKGASFDAVVLAVRHDQFAEMTSEMVRSLLVPGGLVYDLKGVLPLEGSDARL